MIKRLKTSRAFTLIELLIVVAIIGILAAVGISQYGHYRMRGFNVAAMGDLSNFKSVMEAYYSEHQTYP